MSSRSWAGFTDEDIEKIKLNPTVPNLCGDSSCDITVSTAKNLNRGPMKIKSPKCVKRDDLSDLNDNKCLLDKQMKKDASISKSKAKKSARLERRSSSTENPSDYICKSSTDEQNETDAKQLPPTIATSDPDVTVIQDISSERREEQDQSLLPLEVFELRQKRIEAENARRRALINKAITDKKKRTQAETDKLTKITAELNRLDSILSADVSILRNYIEKASMEFSEAEKRYLKAEKEFVEAKLLLFEKMQRKEQLTEHLCAIIEQNENRKANKLVELMKQLEMDSIIEDYEVNEVQPILTNLCMLNDEAYHSCHTLKPCSSPITSNTEENQTRKSNDSFLQATADHQVRDTESESLLVSNPEPCNNDNERIADVDNPAPKELKS
ncbi:RAB6-interacting golgin, partial [Stegodyphus mimosarum]